jgi:hypothetical protein
MEAPRIARYLLNFLSTQAGQDASGALYHPRFLRATSAKSYQLGPNFSGALKGAACLGISQTF